MIKILKLALPWILIIGSILVLQSERLPSYFSRLFSGLFFLYLFLYNLRKIYKNPKKKLEWVEYLELILSPLASLFAFYAFWVQMTPRPCPAPDFGAGIFVFVSQGFHPLYPHHLLKKVDENFIILLYHFCDAAGTNGDVIIVVIIAAQAGSRGDVVAQRLQIAVGSKMVQHR